MNNHIAHAPGWVYCLDDYRLMFDLTDADLQKRILDYPGGISSVTAEMHALGLNAVSGDEFYSSNISEVENFAEKVLKEDIVHLQSHPEILQAEQAQALDALIESWQQRKQQFVSDYRQGIETERYRQMHMPSLPFSPNRFDIALCSDLLFHTQGREGYSPEHLIEELARVASEVRVYPLLDETGAITKTLGPVMLHLQESNFGVEVRSIDYQQLKGGNAMMRVWAKECTV